MEVPSLFIYLNFICIVLEMLEIIIVTLNLKGDYYG